MIKNLKITGEGFTPSIDFDIQTGILKIQGKSMLEDTKAFYTPLRKWIQEYVQTADNSIVLDIDLSYFNTSSSKELFAIMLLLADYKGKKEVIWRYAVDDEQALEDGKDFEADSKLTFSFISY